MKLVKSILAPALGGALLLTALAGCGTSGSLGGSNGDPVVITVWHYYNGAQQQSFDQLVNEFNEGVGADQKIVVEVHSFGGVGDLTEKVISAIYKEVGADEIPDVFAAYADSAYEINQAEMAADLSQYLTAKEQEQYISSYLNEGRFDDDGFKIFPVAKSTELLSLNQTEWTAFSTATGASEADLSTWEGIARLAGQYYLWTDSLTPDIPEDGKAFFGRDAFANYIIIGSYQLGTELFQVSQGTVQLQVDEAVMRRLWDNYYIPYINGYYAAYGKFRSDDLRTGALAAFVGATSGATYFPTEVTQDDGSTYPIKGAVHSLPNFEGTQPAAVQQGAGMVVTKSTPAQEKAAVTFLKWLTEPEQNMRFAAASGYLPVTYAANTRQAVEEAAHIQEMPPILLDSLNIGVDMAQSYTLYTSSPFAHGYETRQVVERSMPDKAMADRAQVQALIAGGMSRAEAVAQFDTDENFAAWLAEFRAQLKQAAAGF